MKTSTALRLGLFAFGAVGACVWAPAAVADDGTQTILGAQADVGGGQMWTVTGLQPSADSIPFQAAGTLWEATATAAPVGGGIPVVPGFAARADADDYPVLWPVPTANGVNPSALPAGGSTTGKLYFGVVGQAPNSVVYSSNGHDAAMWVQPPPAASGPSTNYSPPPYSSAPVTGAMPAATPKPPAAVTAPAPAATGSSGTSLPAASGSSGTPLPAENSATTPAPASGSSGIPATGSSGSPASGSSGAPATGTQPSAAAATPAATPAPAAASPSAAAPTTAAVAAPTTAAAPSGSAGTPLTAPTTTVVPAG